VPSQPELDAVVIGGGVVGLSLARALAQRGRQVTLLEAEPGLGRHTSSRSSEVIHAGIYYPPASLKARLCVEGKLRLYAYAAQAGVEHRRVGKLIVASSEAELAALESIALNAAASGVHDLERLSANDVAALEPQVRSLGGLLSPSTGIIDSHALLAALKRDAVAAGAELVTSSPVTGGAVTSRGFELRIGGPEPSECTCRQLFNAAGLWAPDVARSLRGVPPSSITTHHLAKGHYYALRGASPFSHLVYPVPVPGGLGVHVTLDLSGAARFGPDVVWTERIDYDFEAPEAPFYAAIRRYYPTLRDGALRPAHVGIRPKLTGPGTSPQDFVVQGPASHSVPGLVNLYGIESPGLTAALALADHALTQLELI
jgi:L-2-hydroxyglutarate oxidase LhgO